MKSDKCVAKRNFPTLKVTETDVECKLADFVFTSILKLTIVEKHISVKLVKVEKTKRRLCT